MADYKVSCFERTMHSVNPVPKNKLNVLYKLIADEKFPEILEFGVLNGCFTERQSFTLHDGIIFWESIESINCSKNSLIYLDLLTRMGVDFDAYKQWIFKNDGMEERRKNSRLIIFSDGTCMSDNTYVCRTDAPPARLEALLNECNKIYLAGGDDEDIPFWKEVLSQEGYVFDFIDEHVNVALRSAEDWIEDEYPDVKEFYRIDNQPDPDILE